MKYMVLECHPAYAVVIDEDGRFLKVANRHYVIGQMVTDVVLMKLPAQKKNYKWMYSLVAMAACLLLLFNVFTPNAVQPYASVYVKINPEVRIDVDKNDTVIGLEGINQDGMDLIEGYSYQKKQLELVTDELVDKAIEMGYLHDSDQITITLDSSDQDWVQNHKQTVPVQLRDYLQDRIAVTIVLDGEEILEELLEEAEDLLEEVAEETVPTTEQSATTPFVTEQKPQIEEDDDFDDDDDDDFEDDADDYEEDDFMEDDYEEDYEEDDFVEEPEDDYEEDYEEDDFVEEPEDDYEEDYEEDDFVEEPEDDYEEDYEEDDFVEEPEDDYEEDYEEDDFVEEPEDDYEEDYEEDDFAEEPEDDYEEDYEEDDFVEEPEEDD